MSARIVCPATIKYVPVNPAKTRMAAKVAMFGANAAPQEQAQIMKMATLYALCRPMSSPTGIHIKDENPMAIKTPELVTATDSWVVENSLPISGRAESSAVLEYVVTNVIQLTEKRIIFLRHAGSA